MTVADLISAIGTEIKAATANLKLPVEYHNERERQMQSTWQKVNVFEQYIPQDLWEQTSYYPCVVVEWLETQDDLKDGATAIIGLTCGVFAKEVDGWKDGLYLTEIIRERLLTVRTVAKRYRLTGKVVWQTPQNQPAPFFFTYAELSYQIYLPQEVFPLESKLPADLITTEKPKVLKVDGFKRRIS